MSDELAPLTAQVFDKVDTGTEKILQSPHVSEGPGRLATAPVPSVFSDDRGEIHRLRVGGQLVNLLYSKSGVMRSGYLHPHAMHTCVVRGKVELWTLMDQGTVKTIYGPSQHFVVKPFVPHILHFLEDTAIVEWWGKEPFRCWYYHPYRRIIDVQNALVSKSTGVFHLLVPKGGGDDRGRPNADGGEGMKKLRWWTAGLVVGVAVGAWFGSLQRRGR